MNFRHKIIGFFRGIYGNDQLNIALLCLYLILSVFGIFLSGAVGYLVISGLQFVLLVCMFYRMFSKNIYKRKNENDKFMSLFRGLINRIKQLCMSVLYHNKVLYRTCPKCRARLRMTRKRGKHTVKCPLCKNEFEVRII